MIVRDYQEWTRYHAVLEFPFEGDAEEEDALRAALRKEIVAEDATRRFKGRQPLFPGTIYQQAVKNAVFEISDGVVTAVITFETEGFRCRTSS